MENTSNQKNDKKVEELINIGNELLDEIKKVKKLLNSSKGWNSLEGIDGGLISSIAVHKKLKKSDKCYENISNLAQQFKDQLEDINIENIGLSSMSNAFIIYFDDMQSNMQMGVYLSQQYSKACALEEAILEAIKDLKNNEK